MILENIYWSYKEVIGKLIYPLRNWGVKEDKSTIEQIEFDRGKNLQAEIKDLIA